MKKFWIVLFFLLPSVLLLAGENENSLIVSSGEFSGQVTDIESGLALDAATVVLQSNAGLQQSTITDQQGFYTIKPVMPGSYTVFVRMLGYKPFEAKEVLISEGQITFRDVVLEPTAYTGPTATITAERTEPFVMEMDKPSTITRITRKVLKDLPSKSIRDAVTLTPGVYQEDTDQGIQVRGGRRGTTMLMVDGMRVESLDGIPYQAIEQMQVITGGLPAKYGDTTSGAIIITTRSYFTE